MLTNGDHIFEYHGWSKSNIYYDKNLHMWIARHLEKKNFLATSKATQGSLLLGPQEWTVHNDSEECTVEDSYTIMMLMTACNDTEFTCNDGGCVNMENRCDGKTECDDGTDEADCTIVVPDIGYNKLLVPPTTRKDQGHLKVRLLIQIINLLEINEVEESFTVRLDITREWYDERLTYHNLKENGNSNTLSIADQKILWYPSILFENVASSNQWAENKDRSSFSIVRDLQYDYQRADITIINNVFLYEGSQNNLKSTKGFTITWICTFQMLWYPFDTQSCTMEFSLFQKYADFADLLPSKLTYSGPQNLAQYFINDMKMCSITNLSGSKGVIVIVTLYRPLLNNFLTVFIPTMILLIVSQLAFVAEETYFDMVVQVNLTVLLVLATL